MSRLITPLRMAAAAVLLFLAAIGSATAQGYDNGNGYGNSNSYGNNNNYGNGSYQEFYDDLSPYGQWINDPQYGYVWVPDAGDDFRPYYSNGHWANTDYGNTWVSNYRWGWAPFHYGRWTYSNYYGWTWIPGNVWGPAWVNWRSGGGNYGWAPLGPGISINIAFGNNYNVPDYWWTFAPQQYILNPRFQSYCHGPRYNNNYVRQTTIINNTYVYNNNTYITGPGRRDLERATGRPVQTVAINNRTRPDRTELRGSSLELYRPNIVDGRTRATERPRQFETARQPIAANVPRELSATPAHRLDRQAAIDRSGAQQQAGDRSQIVRDGIQPMADRPNRVERGGRQEQAQPRIGRQPVVDRATQFDNSRVQQAQPQDRIERQPDIDRSSRFNNDRRMQQAQPHIERQARVAEMQQPQQTAIPSHEQSMPREQVNRSFDAPRNQQIQQMPQRIERPMMEQRQPVQQQRMESPRMERAVPQREMPAQVPAGERPGSTEGRIMRGR